MNKSTLLFIGLLTVVALVLGYNYFYQPLASLGQPVFESESATPVPEPISPIDRARATVSQLTTIQKAWQVMSVPVTVTNAPLVQSQPKSLNQSLVKIGALTSEASVSGWLATRNPGSVLLFGKEISTSSAQRAVQLITSSSVVEPEFVGQTPLVMVDHEGGTVQRLNGAGFTVLPNWQSYCESANDEASIYDEQLAASVQELVTVGVNVVLSPVIDLATAHPILKSRICSSDPVLVATKAGTWISAWQKAGVLPVLKHFPGIGQTTKDLHTSFDAITVTESEALLYRALLSNFSEKPLAVMVSHVGITNQFPDIPCSLSPDCVRQLTQNFPSVLVMTDSLTMKAAQGPATQAARTLPQLAEEAIRAGEQHLVFEPAISETELDEVVAHLVAVADRDSGFNAQLTAAATAVIVTKDSLYE